MLLALSDHTCSKVYFTGRRLKFITRILQLYVELKMEAHLPCFVIVLVQIFVLGVADSTLEGNVASETLPQPSTKTQDDILRRLSVLESKGTEKDDRIRFLENEILQLKQRSKEDRQKISQLNSEIKNRECQCKGGVEKKITNLAKNENITDLNYEAKEKSDINTDATEERTANKGKFFLFLIFMLHYEKTG